MSGPRAMSGPRTPAVAGMFYPNHAGRLQSLVAELFEAATRLAAPSAESIPAEPPLGLLVPHAGLEYSGVVAAAAWRRLRGGSGRSPTVVILGTNHSAAWLDGVGVWDGGPWRIPGGEFDIDGEVARAVVGLGPPFASDYDVHRDEHSIEVQLPLMQAVSAGGRIVPLAVSAGTGREAIEAGARLGELLAPLRTERQISIVVSSDMAHYPAHDACAGATRTLAPAIVGLDPAGLAELEAEVVGSRVRGLLCGMCGIQPAVFGLAALRAFGAGRGVELAAATSAEAGGPPDRTVGYLAVEFR
jgi:AmmeMemoRadiSam system protein B